MVELALWQRDRPPQRVRLGFERGVRCVRLSPDDRLTTADDPECVVAKGD
jgi:hypothetical protein